MIPGNEYQVPEGYHDQPWIYVYDGDALTNGQDYLCIQVPVNDADFHLRRVAGRPTIAGKIQLRRDAAPFFATDSGVVMPPDWVIVPEKVFKVGSAISIDLFTVLKAQNADQAETIQYPQLVFQGVRRWPGPQKYPMPATYKYKEKFWSYEVDVTIDWDGGLDPQPHRFFQDVQDYDFELRRITAVTKTKGQSDVFWTPWGEWKMMLFDQNRNQLMSAPVMDYFLLDNNDGIPGFNDYNSVFPIPAVLYPTGSQIMFELTSLILGSDLDATYQLRFEGARRVRL